MLYLIEILHQTTTADVLKVQESSCILSKFYIKPQRRGWPTLWIGRCILSKFYIKPQPLILGLGIRPVVSYRNSTSNHNILILRSASIIVVSYRNSTSNHNFETLHLDALAVVSYRNSTSNHNYFFTLTLVCCVVSYRNSTSNHN